MGKVAIGEMYPCLQGEGKFIGIPHLLIRVSGCKLRCQFAESFCDTPFASWSPEKGKFTLEDVHKFYQKYPQIKYTMICHINFCNFKRLQISLHFSLGSLKFIT